MPKKLKRLVKIISFAPRTLSAHEKLVFRVHHVKGMVKKIVGLKPKKGSMLSSSAEIIGRGRIGVKKMKNNALLTKIVYTQRLQDKWEERKQKDSITFQQSPELIKFDKVLRNHHKITLQIMMDEARKRSLLKSKKGDIHRISLKPKPTKKYLESMEQAVNNRVDIFWTSAKKRSGKKQSGSDEEDRIKPDAFEWMEFEGEK